MHYAPCRLMSAITDAINMYSAIGHLTIRLKHPHSSKINETLQYQYKQHEHVY
jgi:hypothetical protein